MRSSLTTILRDKLQEKNLLCMTHMVVGYPSIEDNKKMLEVMVEAGADIIELQFPFSEPTADGPLFVKANQSSLDAGTSIEDCFKFFEYAVANTDIPLLMMGYYNTVFKYGERKFCERVSQVGGKGLIVPDLPIELGQELQQAAKDNDLANILITTPNSSLERKKVIAEHADGFIYCVARKGVTGQNTNFDEELSKYLSEVREASDLPLALGFGIRGAIDFDFVQDKADIAIVGTAALKAWEESGAEGLKTCLKG